MSDAQGRLTDSEIEDADLVGWRHEGGALHARYATGDFTTGLRLVNRIGEVAEAADHHPDILLTYPEVSVTLSSHDVGGVTERDLALARKISTVAAQMG